jgi:hypothetical protein
VIAIGAVIVALIAGLTLALLTLSREPSALLEGAGMPHRNAPGAAEARSPRRSAQRRC